MEKVLTIDFFRRANGASPQVGRKEFGLVEPTKAIQIIQQFLDDEAYDVQITYEGMKKRGEIMAKYQISAIVELDEEDPLAAEQLIEDALAMEKLKPQRVVANKIEPERRVVTATKRPQPQHQFADSIGGHPSNYRR